MYFFSSFEKQREDTRKNSEVTDMFMAYKKDKNKKKTHPVRSAPVLW